MFTRTTVLSLALSCAYSNVAAIDLDVDSKDSIIDMAKTLANGIITLYNETISDFGAPGLFPNDYSFGESGAVFNSLIEYSYLTGDSQYTTLISEGMQWQRGDMNEYAFFPLNQTGTITNDEQTTWGLAAMMAAEVDFPKPENESWVDMAISAWETQTLRWDLGGCDGGLRWSVYSFDSMYNYTRMSANGNFFLLSSRLARFTGNDTYAEWAEKSFDWAQDYGLITDTYHVLNGADTESNCTELLDSEPISFHAIFTEGAAVMYNLTDGKEKWADAVKGFVNSTSTFLHHDVLADTVCEGGKDCYSKERVYRGIAAGSYARAAVAAPAVAGSLSTMLETSAKAAASACNENDTDVRCQFYLADGDLTISQSATASDGNLAEVFDSMAVVQGLLHPQAKGLLTNGTASGGANSTEDEDASNTSSAGGPEETGAAGTIAASVTAVLAVAFAAALSC